MKPYWTKQYYLSKTPKEEMENIIKAMHVAVPLFFKPIKGARIQRFILNKLVFKALGLSKTNLNTYLLKSVIKAQGIDEINICGKKFYAGPPKKKSIRGIHKKIKNPSPKKVDL